MDDVEMSPVTLAKPTLSRPGFAGVADFISSDHDNELFVFRKFNKLAARNLLNFQNEILHLEKQQEELDDGVIFSDDDVLCSAMQNYDEFEANLKTHHGLQKRKKLQDRLERKLDQYRICLSITLIGGSANVESILDSALLQQHALSQLEQPTALAIQAYREFIFGKGGRPQSVGGQLTQIMNEEYLKDLVALNRPTDTDALSKSLTKSWLFSGQALKNTEYHNGTRSFDQRLLVRRVRFFSAAVAALLMIISILVLYFVTDQDARLGLVIAFVVLFAIGLSVCTGATRDSIFAGTAAYAAVLIVFVSGNLSDRKANRLGS